MCGGVIAGQDSLEMEGRGGRGPRGMGTGRLGRGALSASAQKRINSTRSNGLTAKLAHRGAARRGREGCAKDGGEGGAEEGRKSGDGEERKGRGKGGQRENQREGRYRRPSRGHRFDILRPQDARKREPIPVLRDTIAAGFPDLNCAVEPPGGGATLSVAKGISAIPSRGCDLSPPTPAPRPLPSPGGPRVRPAGVGIGWRLCPGTEGTFVFRYY